MDIGEINAVIREFGLLASENPGLFGIGKEIRVTLISETVLPGAIEKNGAIATAVVIEGLLNKQFLSVNELRGAAVDALKRASRRSARDLSKDIIALAM